MDLVRHTAHKLAALPADAPLVVAVSGGRDSMTLLSVLAGLDCRSRLHVAHYDHGLRGDASRGDRLFVETTARTLGAPFHVGHGSGVRSDEASLREDRWHFLETLARSIGAVAIATGHHGADQLETLLLRLLRGTGPRGLAGMRERDGLRWRPWIDVAPTSIDEWARAHEVHWREDATNAARHYRRNSLRHSVLPALLAETAPHGGPSAFFSKLADTCEATARLVAAADRTHLSALGAVFTDFFVRFPSETIHDDATLDALTTALGRPLLRDQRRRAVAGTGTRGTWGNGLEWRRSCGHDFVTTPAMRQARATWIARTEQALAEGLPTTPTPVEWRLSPASAGVWRLPRPGDRYGADKLKRRFLEARIPEPERRLYVVLAKDDRVLWAPLPGAEMRLAAPDFPFAVSH